MLAIGQLRKKSYIFSENVLDETQQGIGDTTSERYY